MYKYCCSLQLSHPARTNGDVSSRQRYPVIVSTFPWYLGNSPSQLSHTSFSPSWSLLPRCSCRNSSHVASHFTGCSVKDDHRLKAWFCGIALESGRVDACEKNKLFPKPFTSNSLKMPKKALQQKQRPFTVLAVLFWLFSYFPTVLLKGGPRN